MAKKDLINCIAYASGIGAADPRSGTSLLTLEPVFDKSERFPQAHWVDTFYPSASKTGKAALPYIASISRKLSVAVYDLAVQQEVFLVIGGDHTCAIGTWKGAAEALRPQGDIGLIWIDAHMDSHTSETTHTQNIHGMPLATLLGHGYPDLTRILNHKPALKPENVCLIGVRSYEPEELEFLTQQGVRVFFMQEVKEKGLDAVMQEAIHMVSNNTVGFGVSLDVDALDPQDFPATGIQEFDGIRFQALSECFRRYIQPNQHFLGMDIAEFIPALDKDKASQKKLEQLVEDVFTQNKCL